MITVKQTIYNTTFRAEISISSTLNQKNAMKLFVQNSDIQRVRLYRVF